MVESSDVPSSVAPTSPASTSWASIVSDSKSDLQFVAIPADAVVDGVLVIPQSIVDIGVKKLRSAVVAQFLGSIPPMRVFQSMADRLWGYDGKVMISTLSEGFFLIEFPTLALCDWVLNRSWHVHHSALVLRRWRPSIEPIDFSPKETPVWVTFCNIPPPMITKQGIEWLASRLGRPLTKYVRDGLNVKVCILMDVSLPPVHEIPILVGTHGLSTIQVEYPQPRQYKQVAKKHWVPKSHVEDLVENHLPKVDMQPPGNSATGVVVDVVEESDLVADTMGDISDDLVPVQTSGSFDDMVADTVIEAIVSPLLEEAALVPIDVQTKQSLLMNSPNGSKSSNRFEVLDSDTAELLLDVNSLHLMVDEVRNDGRVRRRNKKY
ncbi:hypothetical protein LINGRAHAP2_LOCUS1255 [Linum grandiflorum]